MAGVKITNFLGKAPKLSPELLPNTAAQIAENCKLYSGDLIPYPQPVVVANTERTGVIKTLYALRNPDDTNDLKWLSWTTDVDIAVASSNLQDEQRFYYSGDGAPKISNYELATTGAAPYPVGYYDLGLPIPPDTQVLTTVAATFTTVVTASRARDAGNTATIITGTAHGLRTGNVITISGFPVGTSTVATFNASNVECTVVNPTTFTYFSPGEIVATTPDVTGKVDLGGLTQTRSYVFTWFTPWDEESIASKPSDNLFIKEGIIVTVSNIPTVKPAGDNFVRGVRLYRTLPSVSGTEYFRLSTLWFPTGLAVVQRTANVSRVTLLYPHNLGIDDRFKISGCTDASFDITGGIVTDIIDDYTFEYAQVAADTASTPVVAGTMFHDVSENPPTTAARYWGDGGNFDFTDDFDSRTLLNALESDDYDPPPDGLQGLTAMQNNILVGFVGNTLYFSEPGLPHAWPPQYATPLGHEIVAIAAIAGSLLVTTRGYPYIVTTNDPAAGISTARIDVLYPNLSARSLVTMGFGLVWSTNDGLAVYAPSGGAALVTKALYNNDTWSVDLDPATVIAEYYGENYFASHSQGSFVFEQDAKAGGFFVDTGPVFTASFYDTQTGRLYYVGGTNGDIFEWDDLSQPALTMEWKSKVLITKDMINLGAARVIADYSTVTSTWDTDTQLWNNALTNWNTADEITFRLWANKELIFATTVNDANGFRLPTGYRTDTFEVGVEGNVRVRAIHLAETMLGLREV
jgi:hypothetical protein